MFHAGEKKEALRELELASSAYESTYRKAVDEMVALQESRERGVGLLTLVEAYVSNLANAPREFSQTINKVTQARKDFQAKSAALIEEGATVDKISGRTVAAGAAAAAGVAAFGPSAAMAVAMTFGTASTGTAIASLSGAAATSAALAWLGGGALAVGGGGMAAGSAFLALAGPIGWAIGATTLLGAGVFANMKNKEVVNKAEASTRTMKQETARMGKAQVTAANWRRECDESTISARTLLLLLRDDTHTDYNPFSDSDKKTLGALVNIAESISKQIGQTMA